MAEFEILDSEEKLKEIDKSGMLKNVEAFPRMLLEAEKAPAAVKLSELKGIKHIFISGLGGSAIAGDIVIDLLGERLPVPVSVIRHYSLPSFAGKGDLLFSVSYSGDTEEVLSVLKEAQARKMQIICITSGGKLKSIAEEKKYPIFVLPSGYPPRAALPYLLVSVLRGLEKTRLAAKALEGLDKTAALLEKLCETYGFQNRLRNNPVKQLAKKLLGKIPVIFSSTGTTFSAGLRWKTQFNENSKVTALFNVFPELNHNELVNLSVLRRGKHNFSLIILRDDRDNERMKKRIEITKSLLGAEMGGVVELFSQGETPLARILSLIYFGDFLSVYLAVLQGIDPTPVEIISRLKKELSR